MKIGVLTGGGDCPGLNPALRAIVLRALDFHDEVIGIKQGWKGLVTLETVPMELTTVEDLIRAGGTMLESSRTNPVKDEDQLQTVLGNIKALKLDALIAMGGEDTLGGANKLAQMGVPAIGVPKTMDNDISETDYTFGFDSACSVAVDACDRLLDTSRSHRRIAVLEVFGRHVGWTALYTAVCGGADAALIPEVMDSKCPMGPDGKHKPADKLTEDEKRAIAEPMLDQLAGHLSGVRSRRNHGLVVVAEGLADIRPSPPIDEDQTDEFGRRLLKKYQIGEYIADQLEARLGWEARSVVLGHVMRGGAPTPFDRWLATRLGLKAVELAHEQKWGRMSALRGTEIIDVPLKDAVGKLKKVPLELYQEIQPVFK